MTAASKDVFFGAPTAAITSGPAAGGWSGATATFAFSAGVPASYTCSTGGAWSSCSSPVRLTGLAAGQHTFGVRASNMNGAGQVASRTWKVDTAAPTVRTTSPTVPFQVAVGVRLAWAASDPGSGTSNVDVRYRIATTGSPFGGYVYPSTWQRTTATSATMNISSGTTLCFAVRARDRVGNLSEWTVERCVARPLDDSWFAASTGWTRHTGSAYWNGTYASTTRSLATLTRTNVTGNRGGIIATRCPTCGTVALYLGGTYLGSIDLRASVTTRGSVLFLPRRSTALTGTLTLKVTSSGRLVEIDGIGLSRG
jgi:hypothetical protein